MPPYRITLELGQANARAGWLLPDVISIVRRLPGLENYSAVDEWAERMRRAEPPAVRLWEDAPADGPPLPTPKEVRHSKRGERLAALVTEYGEQLRPAPLRLLGLPAEGLADLVSRQIAAEVPDLLEELEKE